MHRAFPMRDSSWQGEWTCQWEGMGPAANCTKYRTSQKFQALLLKVPTNFIFYLAMSLVLVQKWCFSKEKNANSKLSLRIFPSKSFKSN